MKVRIGTKSIPCNSRRPRVVYSNDKNIEKLLQQAYDVLTSIESRGSNPGYRSPYICPYCSYPVKSEYWNPNFKGHTEDCSLKNVLEKLKGFLL